MNLKRIKHVFIVLLVLMLSSFVANAAMISGTVSYTGGFGEYTAYVKFFSETDMTVKYGNVEADTGSFSIEVPDGTYIVYAFLDKVSPNGAQEPNEPLGMYKTRLTIPGDTYTLGEIKLSDVDVVLNVSGAAALTGETINIDISTDAPSNIAEAAFTVLYDHTKLKLKSINTVFFEKNKFVKGNISNGVIMVAAVRDNPPSVNVPATTLATLEFEIIGNIGDSAIVNVVNSLINNTGAGYTEKGEFIPMITGIESTSPCQTSTLVSSVTRGIVSVSCSDGWFVYDNTPESPVVPVISSVEDNVLGIDKCVTKFVGNETQNGYRIGYNNPATTDRVVEWKMKYSEDFYVLIDVQTTNGHRYITYKPVDYNAHGTVEYVIYGIGESAKNGEWQSFKRDLAADLDYAQAGNTITAINGFIIMGSGLVDDINMTNDQTGVNSNRVRVSVAPVTNSFGMTFNSIPTGTFAMGSQENPDDPSWSYFLDETKYEVTLTNAYYMQTTEVTQAQWKAVLEEAESRGILNFGADGWNYLHLGVDRRKEPSEFVDCSTCPVESVSIAGVKWFIKILNQLGEGTYRLPTEAEWEYSCRAGSTTDLSNGPLTNYAGIADPNLDLMGWYALNSGNQTHTVAQKSPNAWGLFDMHGNVYELCQGYTSDYPSGSVIDPTGSIFPAPRNIIRGGAFNMQAAACRSAFRQHNQLESTSPIVGFRLCRNP